MLSRGKLVQDWRRRLAAAEADGAEGERRTWLARMRLRLYRFLLSCYQDADWRADEPAVMNDETVADVSHGNTTTLLDVRLDGKPAKTVGKMQAVLKSVSAAQDHPAQAGPLLGGIAAEDWVVAVSVRDKLNMQTCARLLDRFNIPVTCTSREIKVRHCDLGEAVELLRKAHQALRSKSYRVFPGIILRPNANTYWPAQLLIIFLLIGPVYAGGIFCLFNGLFSLAGAAEKFNGPMISLVLVFSYLLGVSFAGMQTYFRNLRRAALQLVEAEREIAFQAAKNGN